MHVRLDNSTRVVAKSISFASMSQDEFDELYSKAIDVVIKYVCRNYTGEQLKETLDMVESFA